ncbi:hypothetical protein DE146DRAFT_622698, partial [Phaeosphaeria sp. MPI-PUGE-AT-0046c]
MAVCLLMRLPAELHLNIIDKLELQDTIVLARTNQYFRSIIPTPTHGDLMKAEADNWAKDHGLYACSGCVNLRRFEDFADDMKKGKRSRGGAEATERLCLRCGVARGVYTHGVPIKIYGRAHVLCQLCGRFTDRTTRHPVCEACLPSVGGPPAHADELFPVYEHVSARTARVYCGRTPTYELYGVLVMAPAKDEREPPALFSAPVDGSPQRPKNLLQRLTSGLSTLLPNKASRRSSASNSDRPKTAPFPYHKHKHILRLRRHPPNHELMITPHISIPKLSDADSTRPYDSSTYHSSTSNEGEHSRIRDLSPFFKRASASSASDRPCNHCHSRIPSSNLASPLRCSSRRDSCSSDICSDLPSVDEASLFIEDIPCIVPYELAARRIGNPPRKSSLPTGLRPSYSTSHLSPTAALDSHSTRDSRPVSPRLHHLHGLPHAHSHPYVRESEVDAHIAALEAGSLSPLLQAVDEEGPAIPNSNKPCRDFSRTVYYGTTPASA